MNEHISIRRFPYDDPAWHVELKASNGRIVTTIDSYTEPADLQKFGAALCAFSGSLHQEARFEIGNDLGHWAYHLYLRACSFDALGHSAMEILTDNRGKHPDHVRVTFAIRCEIASLNRLGHQLAMWIEAPCEPLIWNSRSSDT